VERRILSFALMGVIAIIVADESRFFLRWLRKGWRNSYFYLW